MLAIDSCPYGPFSPRLFGLVNTEMSRRPARASCEGRVWAQDMSVPWACQAVSSAPKNFLIGGWMETAAGRQSGSPIANQPPGASQFTAVSTIASRSARWQKVTREWIRSNEPGP